MRALATLITCACSLPGAATASQDYALRLDGNGTYGTAATSSIPVANTTWEAWIQIQDLDASKNYFGNVLSRWGTWTSFAPNLNAATGEVTGTLGYGAGDPNPPTAVLSLNTWHHVAVVNGPESSPSWSMYVDGVLAGSTGPGTQVPGSTMEIILGANNYLGYKEFLRADVDEARISSIQRYSGNFQPQARFTADSSTIGLWHFDEGAGSVAVDDSGNGRHFQLFGAYQWVDGVTDCNNNGVLDDQDIANGTSSDCDGNGIPDECDIAADPAKDWNGDGILDVCTPPNYCTANPNTTGLPAVMLVSGSPLIADNNLTLMASQMPAFEWGYFLMSPTQGFIPNVGGSAGNLCIGAPIYRFNKPPAGQVLNSGAGGAFSLSPDLNNLPQGVIVQVGETWNFQAWFRDGSASTSNFTDGIEVMFR